jgi:uncharacterized membrane protein YebE (DUF533 family)
MEGGSLTVGILIAVAGVAFTGYVIYQVVQKRKELRDTVHVLTREDTAFVDDLEDLKASGALCPAT